MSLEINPLTKQIVWEYKQPKLSKDLNGDGKILGNEKLFFSNLMSGAQRLPNGNTLITEADVGRIFEVTNSGEVVWGVCAHLDRFLTIHGRRRLPRLQSSVLVGSQRPRKGEASPPEEKVTRN